MSEHNPTPWRYDPVISALVDKRGERVISSSKLGLGSGSSATWPMADGNAAYILEACNEYGRLKAVNEELVKALERTATNFKLAVAGKPVRDMAETLAEVDSALAKAKELK